MKRVLVQPTPPPASKFIRFADNGFSKTGKTKRWIVWSKEGDMLGEIQWWGAWRCYVFYAFNCYFEQRCLRDIANFVEYQTKLHRQCKKDDKVV